MPKQAAGLGDTSVDGSRGTTAGSRGGPTRGPAAPTDGGPGGPTAGNGMPPEGGPGGPAAAAPAGKPVRLNVSDTSENALEPSLDTPAQLPHQQKQLR